jgi:hypothetical protein
VNRRKFFGMSAAALIGAGLPLALLPEKTIFLPPKSGWPQTSLVMREIRQYLINDDSMPMRYDVAWGVNQWHIDFPELQWSLQHMNPKLFDQLLENQRAVARRTFEEIRRRCGFSNADLRQLPLPRFARAMPCDPWTNDCIAGYV